MPKQEIEHSGKVELEHSAKAARGRMKIIIGTVIMCLSIIPGCLMVIIFIDHSDDFVGGSPAILSVLLLIFTNVLLIGGWVVKKVGRIQEWKERGY